jgi:hypothetical protein
VRNFSFLEGPSQAYLQARRAPVHPASPYDQGRGAFVFRIKAANLRRSGDEPKEGFIFTARTRKKPALERTKLPAKSTKGPGWTLRHLRRGWLRRRKKIKPLREKILLAIKTCRTLRDARPRWRLFRHDASRRSGSRMPMAIRASIGLCIRDVGLCVGVIERQLRRPSIRRRGSPARGCRAP